MTSITAFIPSIALNQHLPSRVSTSQQFSNFQIPFLHSHPKALLPPFPISPTVSDVLVTTSAVTLSSLWLLLWQTLTSKQVINSAITRKVIHTTSGPAFLFFWPFYSDLPSAHVFAAIIPSVYFFALLIAGKSKNSTLSSLGRAVSRKGRPEEALKGPLYYTAMLSLCTLAFFKTTPAVVAITQLALGDGMAEPFGRRFGASNRLPWRWAGGKSLAGSVGFFIGGFLSSIVALQWVQLGTSVELWKIAFVSIICAAVELACPVILGDDNISVTAAAVITCLILFGNPGLW